MPQDILQDTMDVVRDGDPLQQQAPKLEAVHASSNEHEDSEMQDAQVDLQVKDEDRTIEVEPTATEVQPALVRTGDEAGVERMTTASTPAVASDDSKVKTDDQGDQSNEHEETMPDAATPSVEAPEHPSPPPEASAESAEVVGNFHSTENTNATPIPHAIPAPASGTSVAPAQNHAITSAPATGVAKIQSHPVSRAASVAPQGNGETHTTGAPARVYLKEQVNDYLLEGMRWLALTRPENGLLALGKYLCGADRWRSEPGKEHKTAAEFQRYWLQFQAWKDNGNSNMTLEDYKSTLK